MSTIVGRINLIEQILTPDGMFIERVSRDCPLFEGMDGMPHVWQWTDGNMSCDCNRATAFDRVVNCNPGGNQYKLNLLTIDRVVLHSEFDLPNVTDHRARSAPVHHLVGLNQNDLQFPPKGKP